MADPVADPEKMDVGNWGVRDFKLVFFFLLTHEVSVNINLLITRRCVITYAMT